MLCSYSKRIGPLPQTRPLGHNPNLSHLLKLPQDRSLAPSSPWEVAQEGLGRRIYRIVQLSSLEHAVPSQDPPALAQDQGS